MEIRELRPEDTDEAAAIWNEVVRAGRAVPQREPLATQEEARAFFDAQTRTAVAVERDHVRGLSILHPNNVGRCAHIANASYAVAEDARGRGVGRALVTDSLDRLRACGFTGLQFNAVVANNAPAIALYEDLGFVRVGTIPAGFMDADGAYQDIHIFYHPAPSP